MENDRIDPAEQAHRDQIEAEIRDLAGISYVIFRQYQNAGFTEDEAFELVSIWNAHFAERTCS